MLGKLPLLLLLSYVLSPSNPSATITITVTYHSVPKRPRDSLEFLEIRRAQTSDRVPAWRSSKKDKASECIGVEILQARKENGPLTAVNPVVSNMERVWLVNDQGTGQKDVLHPGLLPPTISFSPS